MSFNTTENMRVPLRFKKFTLPANGRALIPEDLDLVVPRQSSLDADRQHFLIYIPWDEKYMSFVDTPWQPFFREVLPYLGARTTDVHIARCMPFIEELISAVGQKVDQDVITIAFILHDSGWSQMSDIELARSLGVSGLKLTDSAMGPKEKHAVLGAKIAEQVLETSKNIPSLSSSQKELITRAVLLHDKPWELATGGQIPLEMQIVCDVDHLWSFTKENFWQDTVRKGIKPDEYAKNLAADLNSYFVTEQGKDKARALLKERLVEVKQWAKV